MEKSEMEVIHKGKVIPLEKVDVKLYEILKKLPAPDAAMKITRAQKKWWVWFGVELLSTKELSKLDLIHLQKASFWMDARCQAYKKVSDLGYEGFVQTFKNGTSNITGHISIIEKADKHLEDVSAHFGFSIRDRSKLKVERPVDNSQLNLFEQLKATLSNG
jgi:hypothetical protein